MAKPIALMVVMNTISILYYLLPPRKINPVYGYRTRKATSSPVIVAYANKYASRCLLLASSINTTFILALILCNISPYSISVFTTILSLVVTIVRTEYKLSSYQLPDKPGDPR